MYFINITLLIVELFILFARLTGGTTELTYFDFALSGSAITLIILLMP